MRISISSKNNRGEWVVIGEARYCDMTTTIAGQGMQQDLDRPGFFINVPENIMITLGDVYFYPEYLGMLRWTEAVFRVTIDIPHDSIQFNNCFVTSHERTFIVADTTGARYDRMNMCVNRVINPADRIGAPLESKEVKEWLARWARR